MTDPEGAELLQALTRAAPEWTVAETLLPGPWLTPMTLAPTFRPQRQRSGRLAARLPKRFDWRERTQLWPARDQQNCNTCTAFAICATASDIQRINAPHAVELSPWHVHWCIASRSCSEPLSPEDILSQLADRAVAAASADEHLNPPDDANCAVAKGVARITYRRISTESQARTAIESGPIIAIMRLYDDFWRGYKGGIYRRAAGIDRGAHTIEVVGYDDFQRCWVVKNSRGRVWGEDGFGLIAYGECGIFTSWDGYQLSVMPNLTS